MISQISLIIFLYMNKYISAFALFFLFFTNNIFTQVSLPGMKDLPDPEVEIHFDKESYRPGESGLITVNYMFPDEFHQTLTPETFKLEGSASKGIVYGQTLYPEGVEKDGVTNYYNSAELQMEFFLTDTVEQGDFPIEIEAYYQLCDEKGTCYFPESIRLDANISIQGKPAGANSVLYYLLLALIGGFLLNLMPCVLPLLSVKALNLVNQSQGDRKSTLLNAVYYAAGILVSFLALSLVIIILQQSGRLLGWGFQFQNPYFLIVLISVIFLFALSLFEVFILLPPSSGLNKASSLSGRKGHMGSFFTGVFAVFVATPCTAPFLGAAMGFAFSQPAGVILGIMMATGMGFSLPFLILGFIPSFFKVLPKPGKWMDKFREFMAFLLMGTVVYLSGTLMKQIGESFITVFWYLLILALAGWIWGWIMRTARKRSVRNILILITTLAVLLSGTLLLGDLDTPALTGQVSNQEGKWKVFSPEAIAEEREAGETVFLAFSASWCTTCKINEKTVLHTREVEKLFEEHNVKLYKADLTVTNETAMEWIYSFDRAGVPLYILYKKGEDPRVLPEILSFSLLENELSE